MTINPLAAIDNWLNKITMYRLTLYVLIAFLTWAVVWSNFGKVPIDPEELIFSTGALVAVAWVANKIFARIFSAPGNVESVYITALILALIINPASSMAEIGVIIWAGVISAAVKYVFAVGKKHIFNPAAMTLILVSAALKISATWWIGNVYMLPVVLVGGLLIVRKIRRGEMAFVFLVTTFALTALLTNLSGGNVIRTMNSMAFNSSVFFFAFIMFVEPLTAPGLRKMQIIYGVLVGILFTPQLHIGRLYLAPELALVMGNLFAYVVNPKVKLVLKLSEKVKTSPDSYDFIFKTPTPVHYSPGRYMEWTLAHPQTDARGNRRYFTLASSPTENNLRIGVKFNPEGSSFKRGLLAMDTQTPIVASQLAGEFTLPSDPKQKCVFIAGGIGITPFRSMIKYLLDKKESRPIIVVYANKTAEEIVYKDILAQAEKKLNIKTIYTLTDREHIPAGWTGKVGRIDENIIRTEIPDFAEREFYLSGPHGMVTAYEEVLGKMGVRKSQIKIDFFPGYA